MENLYERLIIKRTILKRIMLILLVLVLGCYTGEIATAQQDIPLPEHPRPDFQRGLWQNLNGNWGFRFDSLDMGEKQSWYSDPSGFDRQILVPFPWGSALSGVRDEADIAWYNRPIKIPADWSGNRVFVVVGASDWITKAWIDGHYLGSYQGGYTPFEFDITPYIKPGQQQQLTLRVDDTPRPFKLEGKQGYGEAKGIWQTIYLEARGENYIQYVHFTPDIDLQEVNVKVSLNSPAMAGALCKIKFLNGEQTRSEIIQKFIKGQSVLEFRIPVEKMRLWDLDDPFLYYVEASLWEKKDERDCVKTYFGMRKISVVSLPVLGYPYVALNNKPVYLQTTLDQSYHEQGFYTFPSDNFMKEEILRSKRLGLNSNRIHIKCEVPRKLYWADRLGFLIMADVPNWWGDASDDGFREWEVAMRGMIRRDFNHPSIFQWVLFNETWGLFTRNAEGKGMYLPETQNRVESLYHMAKKLDPSRLVEDNSPCNYDHVVTDINSWHAYLPGYRWKSELDKIVDTTYPGSAWNYIGGRTQGNQPLYNSECGNVWGYQGSTGDCDWSWDYHLMMNEFRSHPKICGWLYTEHHDVINEWNGYYRFDRSEKETGLGEIVSGMTLNDLHSEVYLAPRGPLCQQAEIADNISVPLFLSCMTGRDLGGSLTIRSEILFYDQLGNVIAQPGSSLSVPNTPWMAKELALEGVKMPDNGGLAVLALRVESPSGVVLHRNFKTFRVGSDVSPRMENLLINGRKVKVVRFAPSSYIHTAWSLKQWNIMEDLKVNGAGWGYFEYRIALPEGVSANEVEEITLVAELSAKQLFGKDKEGGVQDDGDYMRGKGLLDPSLNPNAYPMTDMTKFPSTVRIRVEGESIGTFILEDDPADHRGILSWYAQPQDGKLNEAGSYGYLVKAAIPKSLLLKASDGQLTIRFEVDEAHPGGLAIYGERFGRYPVDPTLIFLLKQ
jgi:hypothetical protein